MNGLIRSRLTWLGHGSKLGYTVADVDVVVDTDTRCILIFGFRWHWLYCSSLVSCTKYLLSEPLQKTQVARISTWLPFVAFYSTDQKASTMQMLSYQPYFSETGQILNQFILTLYWTMKNIWKSKSIWNIQCFQVPQP